WRVGSYKTRLPALLPTPHTPRLSPPILGRRRLALVLFHHADAAAAVGVFDGVHVGLHQQDAAAGTLEQVFLGGGVRNLAALEAGAFVLDLQRRLFRRNQRADVHLLGRVELVPVFDGVDQRLFEADLDGEERVGVVALFGDG